jgi:GntR family transcriptional regulator
LFTLDRYGSTPIYTQLVEQVELRILDGTLHPQDPLPSVRSLSMALGINPNTLQKGYTELERRGICRSAPGSGRFVAEDAPRRVADDRRAQMDTLERIAGELAMAGVPLNEAQARVEAGYHRAAEAQTKNEQKEEKQA